jgi:hypothetical protein
MHQELSFPEKVKLDDTDDGSSQMGRVVVCYGGGVLHVCRLVVVTSLIYVCIYIYICLYLSVTSLIIHIYKYIYASMSISIS